MPPGDNGKDDSWLIQQWIIAGIVSASARFIPIPFLDDIVRDQCRRFVVSRTVAASTNNVTLSELKPYYSGGEGCIAGCVMSFAKLPLKLLLFPVRKLIAIVTSVRGVPMEIIRTVLIGRTLERQLRKGPITSNEAGIMKTAFDEAFTRMDFRTIRAAIKDAVRSVSNWKSSAMASARKVADERDASSKGIPASVPVENSAAKVQQVLKRPETAKLFAEFDSRFDEAYRKHTNVNTSERSSRP